MEYSDDHVNKPQSRSGGSLLRYDAGQTIVRLLWGCLAASASLCACPVSRHSTEGRDTSYARQLRRQGRPKEVGDGMRVMKRARVRLVLLGVFVVTLIVMGAGCEDRRPTRLRPNAFDSPPSPPLLMQTPSPRIT